MYGRRRVQRLFSFGILICHRNSPIIIIIIIWHRLIVKCQSLMIYLFVEVSFILSIVLICLVCIYRSIKIPKIEVALLQNNMKNGTMPSRGHLSDAFKSKTRWIELDQLCLRYLIDIISQYSNYFFSNFHGSKAPTYLHQP